MTPIQEILHYVDTLIGNPKEYELSNDELKAYHNIRVHLRSKLQTEKEWAEKVWEAANKWSNIETLNYGTARENQYPDFNTFYSQYTEDNSILNQTK